MARPKKDNTPLSARIDTQLYNRLNEHCEKSGQTKTTAIERALEMYIDRYDRRIADGISQDVPEEVMKMIVQGVHEARKEVREYQDIHEKLVVAMQKALGLDPEEIEALEKAGDFDALQKMVDDAISKVVE